MENNSKLADFAAFTATFIAVAGILLSKANPFLAELGFFRSWRWIIAGAVVTLVGLITKFSPGRTIIAAAILLLILFV